MAALLEPKEITITDASGNERSFILSKFPAIQGREIVAKYPTSNMPKIGDYRVSEETMMKLMAFVAVKVGDTQVNLTTRDMINNHAGDWETLAKIEWEMMEYNCSFFRDGRALNSLQGFVQKTMQSIFKTLMDSSEQSSTPTKPDSTN